MPAVEFTALLVLAAAMSFSPGPNTALAATLAAHHGLRPSLRFVCAVPVGWCLLLLLTAAGVGALVLAMPALRWAIKLLGAGYLLWLALRLARAGQLAQARGDGLALRFWHGVGLQFMNIKAWLLMLTVVAGWVAGHADAWQRLAVVLPVMAFFALSSNLLYACAGALLRGWLAHGRRLLWFNRLMALLLVLTGCWMLVA